MTDIEVTVVTPEQMARDFEIVTPDMVDRAKRFREVWEEYEAELGKYSPDAYDFAAKDLGMTRDEAYSLLSVVSNADFYKLNMAN